MTGLLHEKEFSRTAFLKGGGAMVIAISGVANAAAAVIPTSVNFGDTVEQQGYDPPTVDHPSEGSFAQRTAQGYLNQGNATTGINNVDVWLTVNADNTVTVTHGETETGTGTPTGILAVVAEEMNMSMSQMWYARPETWMNYTGGGGGSGGISSRSTQIRAAAAYAKIWLLQMASAKLNVPVANLTVTRGVISGGSSTLTYGSLVNGQSFASILPAGYAAKAGTSNMPVSSGTSTTFIPGAGVSKPVSQYTIVGNSYPRIDVPSIVTANTTYIQNVRVPGMVHARRVRPRGAGAVTFENDTPVSVNTASIANIPGAQVVQIGNFLAVTAPQEYDAIQAAAQLEVQWNTQAGFPKASGDYWTWLRQVSTVNAPATAPGTPRYISKQGNAPALLATAAHTVTATYHYHYNTYVPIGPHCAVADITPGGQSGIVYVQGQSITGLGASGYPAVIGTVLNPASPATAAPAPQNIRVVWYEGSGSYGTGQAGEVAEEAVAISTKIGKPVRVQWMRWDQTGWDAWGPAQMYDVTMGSDANGNIIAANWQAFGQSQSTLDETERLLGMTAWAATPSNNAGITPVDVAIYNKTTFVGGSGTASPFTGAHWAVANTQPLYGGSIKGSFIRAPSAPQGYFAGEQIVDELAHANNMDPVAFRVQNIDGTSAQLSIASGQTNTGAGGPGAPATSQADAIGVLGARWLSVLDAATQQAGWNWSEISKNLSQTGKVRKGRGFAFGTYAGTQIGMVADVSVNMVTGKISVLHLTVAQNNGITASVQGVGNQMSGSAIMGVSRCMVEEATWNTERLTTLDWVTYPILRMADCPSVTLINVHPGQYTVIVPGDMQTSSNAGTSVSIGNTNAFNQGWLATGSGEPPLSACGSSIANAFFNATGARIRYAPMTPATARGALKAAGVLMT
jgi:CO/xanthine dehydrogenase Mo-binding subunit